MNPLANSTSIGILAGGEGRRVNGEDKGLLNIAGQPLLSYGLSALQLQLANAPILVSANRNLQQYQLFGTVITDTEGQQGPLAGIAGLLQACKTDYLLTLPCDCPRIPDQLFEKLARSLLNDPKLEAAVVHDGQRQQNAVLLLKQSVTGVALSQLANGHSAIHSFLERLNMATVIFDDWPAHYWNANTTDALDKLIREPN